MNAGQDGQPLRVGTVVAGKLRIIRQLGAGGMGTVFEVEHELTRHRRALKLLHAQMAVIPGVVERFLREASAAGRIGNPHIVETFDAGLLDTGEPYIVMELLEGRTLADLLAESGPLDLKVACNIVVQACDAVHSAHRAGIVHRDLKPENLFLSGADGSFVKILDFGISKFDVGKTGVEGLTMEGAPIGTPNYMSPEQIKGEMEIDARTDVYALGVVLYECVTGRRPFESGNLLKLIHLVSYGNCAPPSTLRPGLPAALDAMVAKAMSLDRNQRYASAQEFANALARLRQSLPPTLIEATVPMKTERPPAPGTLVMTPQPVSKTLGGPQLSVWPRRTTVRRLILLGLGALTLFVLAVAFGPMIGRAMRGTSRAPVAQSHSGTLSAGSSDHAAQAQVSATAPSPEPSTAASEEASKLAPAAASSIKPEPPRVYPPAASSKRSASTAPTRRADSYGLSKDNPFK
jgi:serine/threonine-protein kinase